MLTNELPDGDRAAQSTERPSFTIVRPSDEAAVSTLGGAMADPNSQGSEWLAIALPTLSKLVPAALGALIMVAIDPPATRRELFWRLVAAGMCSMFFGEIAMDFLHSLAWFAFLDPLKHSHQAGVNFLVGGSGWFVLGGVGVLLKRFKGDPTGTIGEAKKDLTP